MTPPPARTRAGAPASTLPKLGPYRRNKIREIRRAHGIPGLLPAEHAHNHIQWLLGLGFTRYSIAAAASLGASTIKQIAAHAFANTHTEVVHHILTVTHQPVPQQAGMRVPALGAARRIKALQALGWTYDDIGAHTGMTASFIGSITRRHSIRYETWTAIEHAYNTLSATPGPSELTRKRSSEQGFAPPLAWEGVDIDHPDARPLLDAPTATSEADPVLVARILAGTHRGPVPKPERDAVLEHAVENGWTGTRLARHLNLSHDAGDQAIVRARRKRKETAA